MFSHWIYTWSCLTFYLQNMVNMTFSLVDRNNNGYDIVEASVQQLQSHDCLSKQEKKYANYSFKKCLLYRKNSNSTSFQMNITHDLKLLFLVFFRAAYNISLEKVHDQNCISSKIAPSSFSRQFCSPIFVPSQF